MTYRARLNPRRGTTAVEAGAVLAVMLVVVVGALDLGVAEFRQHVLDHAARHAARAAAVRGSDAAVLGPWGPAAIGPVVATADTPVAAEVRGQLPGLAPADVTLAVEWPDGDNEPGSRVRVTLRSAYRPAIVSVFGGPMQLTATATSPISH